MKILDRYILRELLAPFSLSVGIVFFLLLTQQMLRMAELFIEKGVALLTVLELFLHLVPAFLVLTLPVAVLIASISAFNRLSSDHELVALKAAGIGIGRLLKPVALGSAVICVLVYYLAIVAMPWSGQSLKDLALKLLKTRVSVGIEQGAFNELIPNMVLYVDEMPSFSELKGIFIYDLRDPEDPGLILAREGTLLSDPDSGILELRLLDGSLHQKREDPLDYQRIIFSRYRIKFDLNALLGQPAGGPQIPLKAAEIREKIRAAGGHELHWLRQLQDYYRNFAIPMACIIFGFLGVPLGIHTRRAGRLGGFAIGGAVVSLYYLLMVSGEFLMASRFFTPLMSAWFPNLVLALITLLMIIPAVRDTPWRLWNWGS